MTVSQVTCWKDQWEMDRQGSEISIQKKKKKERKFNYIKQPPRSFPVLLA